MVIAPNLDRHVFGLKADVKDNIQYVEENLVLYPAGHTTVLYHTEQKTQKFIPGTPESEGITALAVSSSKKYVAVAERADRGVVTVYDLHTLKRRKVLASPEVLSKEFVSMTFSPDGKLLAAQGGTPDWTLVIWAWEKSKVAASVKASNTSGAPLYQVLFNPQEPSIISAVGQGLFRMFRLADSNLKVMSSSLGKRELANYTCHAWLADERGERCVVASDQGEMLLMEGGEVKTALPNAMPDGNSIECIMPYSKGFVCSGSGGVVSIFEKSDDRDSYKKSKSFRIENHPQRILNLAISPSEETLLCTLESAQIFALGLSNSDILKTEDMNFELMSNAFHSTGITGVDTCVRKPLVATCSTDRSVRIWNYMDKSAELVKFFPEEAYSVAFHPSGLNVLVGFTDKLRLMNLLMDDIRTYKEFSIKACRECRFSNGGQYFAAVNGNTVQIYNTYTCENIGNLRGHNGKVRSLHWVPDDSKLVSAGMDGAVYEWKLKDFKREKENVLKGCNYTCVVSTPDARSIFAVGSDRKLKEFDDVQVSKEFDTGVVLTQVALPNNARTLFTASETGAVRSYKFPLTGEYQEYQSHSAAITRLRVSHDDTMLFCVSEDGCLAVFDVRDKEGRVSGKRDKELPVVFAEEVLVTKSDLEEKKSRMAELETQVNELTMQNEYQLRLKDLNLNEKVKDITEKFQIELEADKSKFEVLLQEKNEQEMEYEEKLKLSDESRGHALTNLESQYQAKIMAEVERYQQLLQEKEMLNERWDEQNALLVESHEHVISELTEEYEVKLQEEQLALERVNQDRGESDREFKETTRQLEEDADREIEELKERYEKRLAAEREVGLRLKGENGIMKKKFSALQKDIEDQKDEIRLLFEQKKELYLTIQALEKDISGLKKEILERDDTIGDKERRIHDLKKKNQELEKFKFVLDYKIRELKRGIEPREQEIASMREQVTMMDLELERYHKQSSSSELLISDLKLKLGGLQREIDVQRVRYADSQALVQRFRHDLHETAQHIQDAKALREAVKRLFQTHVGQAGMGKASEIDEDIARESSRQREYLEKSVEGLKRKLAKDVESHRVDSVRIMNENVSLIKEVNELRRELKALKGAQKTAAQAAANGKPRRGAGGRRDSTQSLSDVRLQEALDTIEQQKAEIGVLRDQLERFVDASRPVSRGELPEEDGEYGAEMELGSPEKGDAGMDAAAAAEAAPEAPAEEAPEAGADAAEGTEGGAEAPAGDGGEEAAPAEALPADGGEEAAPAEVLPADGGEVDE